MVAGARGSKWRPSLGGAPRHPAAGDLVRRYFLLQDERPGDVEEVEIGALDPFLRSLLFTDGTVTRALAVQMLAPISVSPLSQEEVSLPADVAAYLETEAGERAIRRRVGIGVASTPVIWAESHLLADRLPSGFLGLLDGAPEGIGQSLQRVALESYRELLWFGLDARPDWASPAAGGGATIRRLYRLLNDRHTSILISESFAVEWGAGAYRLASRGAAAPSGQPQEGGPR